MFILARRLQQRSGFRTKRKYNKLRKPMPFEESTTSDKDIPRNLECERLFVKSEITSYQEAKNSAFETVLGNFKRPMSLYINDNEK